MTKVSESTKVNNANTVLADSFRACVNDGIVLGLKESLKSLHHFLIAKSLHHFLIANHYIIFFFL